MNTPPAAIIRQLLVDSTLGNEVGASDDSWPVYVSFLPDEPDSALCIYDTAGKFDGRIMRGGEQIEHPGIMIRARSRDYVEGWGRANSIAKTLDQVQNNLVLFDSDETYQLHNISRPGPILPLGVDVVGSKRRHEFSINLLLTLSSVDGLSWTPLILQGWHPFYVMNP